MADGSSSQHDSSPWAQRGFVFAAAFVAVLVLAGLALFIAGRGGDDADRDGTSQREAAPTSTAPAKDPSASVCGLPAGSQRVPAVPPDAEWELVGTIAAPSAPETGPGIERGQRRLCFAHSPTGALFAAVNFIAVTGRSPNNAELLRELTATGRIRDQILQEAAQEPDARDPSTRIQVAGFRFLAYDPSETSVDLALGVNQKGYAHIPVSLRWQRGDWKAVIATQAGPFAALEGLENLSGYVPWSGA